MQRTSICILGAFLYVLQATIMPGTSARRVEFCPILEVVCARDDCGGGPEFEFVVRITGGDPKVKPSYQWSISSGRIIEGEGTARIRVDASGSEDKSLTVRVEVIGYDRACDRKAAPLSIVYTKHRAAQQALAADGAIAGFSSNLVPALLDADRAPPLKRRVMRNNSRSLVSNNA